MITVLGETYFVDLDEIEKYLDMSENEEDSLSGNTEVKINLVKFELIKMMLEVVLSESEETDDKLGIKGTSNISIPFKIAFNSLIRKKLINHF
jgi:hypothetical protein